MDSRRLDEEIDANYDFFRRTLAECLPDEFGKYALLRARTIVGFFDEVADADRAGRTGFPDGIFSIQKVMKEPVDFGFFSHTGR